MLITVNKNVYIQWKLNRSHRTQERTQMFSTDEKIMSKRGRYIYLKSELPNKASALFN